MPYNSIQREVVIENLQQKFDVLVIGGGITGAGVALDAVSRGFSVALIEKGDFASGTSSKSTKLIHGGLRYLKNLELKLVRDTGLERAIAYRNAPHLVRPEKMLLPLIKNGTYGKWATSFGLWLYDVLASVRRDDRRKMLNKKQTLAFEPLLRNDIVKGAGYYAEYRTDDARLTIEILKTAAQKGASIINYTLAEKFIYQADKVTGVVAIDQLKEKEFSISAKYVVNATGPWVDQLRKKDNSLKDISIVHSKGVHVVVPHSKFPIQQSVYFDVQDGRMIFAIPRLHVTYIGTTDALYKGDPETTNVSKSDVAYLLNSVNTMFPSVQLSIDDIVSSWSGLRPLIAEEGKDLSELSRTDELILAESGLITIAGGKLTGYRLMAKKVVRLICNKENITRKCKTRRIRLSGADFKRARDINAYFGKVAKMLNEAGIDEMKTDYLVMNYGTQTEAILKRYKQQQYASLVCAEAEFTIEEEGVCCLEDFYVRRTGKLFFDPVSIVKEMDEVIRVFVKYFKWKSEKVALEKEGMQQLLKKSVQFN